MGWNVPVKPPSDSQIVNEINGFEHVSYGMTVVSFHSLFTASGL
jgi:hypothetical protein